MLKIQKVAVLGSGVMGSGIAAHLANCGIPSYLLDIVPPDLDKILQAKPAHLYEAGDIRLITPGLIDSHLENLRECDWVIEAVSERLAIKKELYRKIEPYLKKEAWVSSNTSGLSLKDLKFREKFCITHFFNPPRYLKLVEVVGEAKELAEFIEEKLGKGVVYAKDTPNFIANRIGVYHLYDTLYQTLEKGWSLEAVDKVMGPPTLRPKSAAFRTADLVGLDTLSLVAKTSYESCVDDEAREIFKNPPFLDAMLAKGLHGLKTGEGFYKKVKGNGDSVILSLDLKTLQYKPQQKFRADSLGKAREITDPAERLRTVVFADDEAGRIAWPLLSNALLYAANRIPEIADSVEEVDRALRWGFNWELGPFEMWDALGVAKVTERLEKEGRPIPKLVKEVLKKGGKFYPKPQLTLLQSLRRDGKVVEKNEGGSVLDLGEGVFCTEFHSKMNAIDGDVIEAIHKGIDRAEKEGVGLLIANEGQNFSVGANLMLIMLTIQQKDWKQVEEIVHAFQKTMQRIRFSLKPVVATPFNYTFGGACEVCLAAAHIEAAAETYMGLVEVGVGILPAGTGCKNMILRWEEKLRENSNPKDRMWFAPEDGGPFPKVKNAFETIAFAKVSTSAKEAKNYAYMRSRDGVTFDRESLIERGKKKVLELAKNYTPPKMREDILLPGRGGEMAIRDGVRAFHKRGFISDYDVLIADTIAHILAGGDRPSIHTTTEDHILDLEREGVLKLCGEEKTLQRMQYMLMQGKPLRN